MELDVTGGGFVRFVLSCILPFISALVFIPFLVHIDKRKHLSAIPNSRSSHIQTVSSIGGVGIFISVIIGILPILYLNNGEKNMLFIAFILLFLIGMRDDVFDSSPYFKLVAQLVVSLIITEGAGLKIGNLYGFLGMYEIPHYMGLLMSMLLIIIIINAINFIDGIDGLAALTGIAGFVVSGMIFSMSKDFFFFTLAMVMTSALLGFLRYNLSKNKKVFMGDTGSLLTGMAFSVFILKIWQLHPIANTFPGTPFWVFSIAMLPLFDFFRVFLIRVTNGKSPMRADRNHVHHVLVDHCGFSHIGASLTLSILAVTFIIVSYIIAFSIFLPLIFLWYVSLFVIYIVILHQIQKTALKKEALNPFDQRIAHKALLNASLKVLSQNYRNKFKKRKQEEVTA